MGGSLTVQLIEPTIEKKRGSLLDTYVNRIFINQQRMEKEVNLDETKLHLKEIREYTVNNFSFLLSNLKRSLSEFNNVEIFSSGNARSAVEYISNIVGDDRKIAVNNSSTINELKYAAKPEDNLQFINTYYDEFSPFEAKLKYNWELPQIEPKIIWDSFCASIRPSTEYSYPTGETATGVIGINAISAADGSMFLLEHFQNMWKIFSTAKNLVFVVGLEKLVKDAADALFQDKCCGLFGINRRILGLIMDAGKGTKTDIAIDIAKKEDNEKTVSLGRKNRRIYIILLDNGRSVIYRSEFQKILHCIGCGACATQCPRWIKPAEEYFRTPRDILFSAFAVNLQYAAEHGLWECSVCGFCEHACPVEIPLKEYLSTIREECASQNLLSDAHNILYERIKAYGNPYGSYGSKMAVK